VNVYIFETMLKLRNTGISLVVKVLFLTVYTISFSQENNQPKDLNTDGIFQDYEKCIVSDNTDCWKYCKDYPCGLNKENGEDDSITYQLANFLELSEFEMNRVLSTWEKSGDRNDIIDVFSETLQDVILTKEEQGYFKESYNFVTINPELNSEEFIPLIEPQTWLNDVIMEYKDKPFDISNNAYEKISQNLRSAYRSWKGELSHKEYIERFTKEQIVFFSIRGLYNKLYVTDQSDYHHISGFFDYYPELTLVVNEALKEVGLNEVQSQYQTTINDYYGEFKSTEALQERLWAGIDENKSFINGRVSNTTFYHKYFSDFEKIQHFQDVMIEYVLKNQDSLYRTE